MALEVGQVVGERYTLTQRLGAGGMGEVFRAHDEVLDRDVALKVLLPHLANDEGLLQRFRREARVLARLRHPGIITVYDMLPVEDDRLAIVLEFVPGQSLDAEIAGGALPWRRCAEIGAQVADALAVAHAAGVVHRDIKPSNILVEPNGGVRVADFGIARIKGDATVTRGGESLGTPAYMSPEQAKGEAATSASDLYSLGAVLFNAATGRQPFESDEGGLVAALAHLSQPVPDPRAVNPAVPDEAAEIIMRALAKEPGARYASADDMEKALRGSAGIATEELPTPTSATETIIGQGPPTPVSAGPAVPAGATVTGPTAAGASPAPPPPPPPPSTPASAGAPAGGSGGNRTKYLVAGAVGVAAVVAVVAGLAIGGVLGGGDDSDSADTTTTEATTTEDTVSTELTTPTEQTVVFDNFDDPATGFETFDETAGAGRYRNGEYELRLTQSKLIAVAESNAAPVGDVAVSAVIRNPSAARDAAFGVVCRFVDDDNYYILGTGRDGYSAIVRWQDNESTVLTGDGSWQQSPLVPEDAPLYKVTGTCEGSTLTLEVNGKVVETVEDSTFTTGETGLFLQTFEAPKAVVRFDDFTQTPLGG